MSGILTTAALACLAFWLIRRYRSIRRGDHPAIGFDDPRIRAEVRRYNAERWRDERRRAV